MREDNIKVKGHKGTWYVIDKGYYRGKPVYLLESEIYGDDAMCLVVDKEMNKICETADGLYNIEDWI